MNGKKSKALRRAAEQHTVGTDERVYVKEKRRGIITLEPGCTRRMYKAMKRGSIRV